MRLCEKCRSKKEKRILRGVKKSVGKSKQYNPYAIAKAQSKKESKWYQPKKSKKLMEMLNEMEEIEVVKEEETSEETF